MNIALIVFAGKGTRIHSKTPKQFIKVKNKNIVAYTIDVFDKHPLIDGIILVTSEEYITYTENLVLVNRFNKIIKIVPGGATRQESVKNGLNSCEYSDNDNVLIHDGDRPLIKDKIITTAIKELSKHDSVVVAIKSDQGMDNVNNLGRKTVINGVSYDIQTPQCFKYNLIKNAHNKLENESFSDDASLIEKEGGEIFIVEGDPINFKITTDKDLEFFKEIINNKDESSSL